MLSIERCRQLLGEKAKHLSDEEVAALRDHMGAVADDLIVGLIHGADSSEYDNSQSRA